MSALHDEIIAHLHAMETAAVERHEELLRRIAAVEDTAGCAGLDVELLHRSLSRLLDEYDDGDEYDEGDE